MYSFFFLDIFSWIVDIFQSFKGIYHDKIHE